MEEVVRAALLGAGPVRGLASNRVDWGERSQGDVLPAVQLQVISDVPSHTMTGPTGWSVARVQADCWAASFDQARALGRAVQRTLDCYRTGDPGARVRIFAADSQSGTESVGGKTVHRRRHDFFVHYQS